MATAFGSQESCVDILSLSQLRCVKETDSSQELGYTISAWERRARRAHAHDDAGRDQEAQRLGEPNRQPKAQEFAHGQKLPDDNTHHTQRPQIWERNTMLQ